MQTDGIKIDKHFPKNLGQYFMDGFGSDGTVVKGLRVITMRGRGISFHGPVNSGEAGGHRSKPEVVLA